MTVQVEHHQIPSASSSGSGSRTQQRNKKSLSRRKSNNTTESKNYRISADGAVKKVAQDPPASVSKKSSRRSQVQPVEMNQQGAVVTTGASKQLRRSRKNKTALKVDTRDREGANSPAPVEIRNNKDLRSPGADKTPSSQGPVPDFITQTDANGNAITPRSADAIASAKKSSESPNPAASTEENVDPCETLLDSIRLMCCCLVPEESSHTMIKKENSDGQRTAPSTPTPSEDGDENVVKLLPAIHPDDKGKKCLVLDLDETLVHSSFRAVPGADFIIPVQIEDVVHFVYVMKRPGVDEFLTEMAKHYEIVVYTASLNKYADPLLDLLDPNKLIRSRLFRESCVYFEGNYVKDLSLLDRDLKETIIVDNSPNSYIFHPENAIDCSSFIDDPKDRELDQIGAFLAGISKVSDVRHLSNQWREWPNVDLPVDQRR